MSNLNLQIMKRTAKEVKEVLNVWGEEYQIEKVTENSIYIKCNSPIFGGCVINAIQEAINMRRYSFYMEYYNNKVQMVIYKNYCSYLGAMENKNN